MLCNHIFESGSLCMLQQSGKDIGPGKEYAFNMAFRNKWKKKSILAKSEGVMRKGFFKELPETESKL